MAKRLAKPKFAISTEPLKKLEASFDSIGEFFKKKNEIFKRACLAIQPLVRSLLLTELKKSGLHLRNGQRNTPLEKLVASAVVYPVKKGIRIGPPRGKSADDYAKMGALQYGAIHGLKVKSAKSRKKIKDADVASGSGIARKAYPYFQLDSGAIKKVEAAFTAALQHEYDRLKAYQSRAAK